MSVKRGIRGSYHARRLGHPREPAGRLDLGLWARDCVLRRLASSTLRVRIDDAETLARFVVRNFEPPGINND